MLNSFIGSSCCLLVFILAPKTSPTIWNHTCSSAALTVILEFLPIIYLLGVHVLHLGKTWEKLMLAARIIVAIENPADVVVISGRPYGQRACYKFAQYTGATFLSGRFTAGTFTNQINKKYVEPRLVIVTDPRIDAQVPLHS